MALPTLPTTNTSSGMSLGGAADLLSIISGKDTKSTTNTGGNTSGTQTNSGGTSSTSGTQSQYGSTSSTGTNTANTSQNSSSTQSQTGTNDSTTSVNSIVANSGSVNNTNTKGNTSSYQANSGSTNKTLDSKNYNSGSTNTDSGYLTTNSGSVNTGTQAQAGTTTNNARTVSSGRTDVSTTKSNISQAALDSMLKTMLSSTTGLASVSSGVRAGGGYSGATNTLLTNDLLARSAAAVAEATRETTTTNVIGESYSDTSGGSATNMSGSSTNNVGGSTSNVGGRTQVIGDSYSIIGGTTSIIGGSSSLGAQTSGSTAEQIVGGSTSSTTGSNKTTGTNSTVGVTNTSGTSNTTGTTNTTGTSSSSGSSGQTTLTGPSTVTSNQNTTGLTTVDTSVKGTGMEGLAGIIGLTVGAPLAVGAVTDLVGSVAGAVKGIVSGGSSTTPSGTYIPGGSGTPNPAPSPTDSNAPDNRDVGEPVDPGVYYGPENPDSDPVGPFLPTEEEIDVEEVDAFPDLGYADGGLVDIMKGVRAGRDIISYTNSLANGAELSARDIARGVSLTGKLSGNSTLGTLGQLGSIATSSNPGQSAMMAAGNIATKGVLGQVMNVGNLLQNPNTKDVANLLSAFNPATALINTLAGLTGLPSIGELLSKIFTGSEETTRREETQKSQEIAIALTPNTTELPPSSDTLTTRDPSTDQQVSDIVSSIPEDEMIEVITDPSEEQASEYSVDPQGYDYADRFDYGQEEGAGNCVHVDSYLPSGIKAGQVHVNSVLHLYDPETDEHDSGLVSYSEPKQAPGYRIKTSSGVSLVCSDTAPIPTRTAGLVTPPKLLGHFVPVFDIDRDTDEEDGGVVWEEVTESDRVGPIWVQHITVGDKCFWAGEKPGAYILHHNLKQIGNSQLQATPSDSGGGGIDPFFHPDAEEYSDGGDVTGPGTGISDSIPARLSHGEYVLPADVVEKLGVDKLDAMVAKYHVPAEVQKLRKLGGK
jgi:hypothetical protein